MCFLCGEGVTKDAGQAVVWFRRAVEDGNADAQYNVGMCYKKVGAGSLMMQIRRLRDCSVRLSREQRLSSIALSLLSVAALAALLHVTYVC